MDFFEPGHGPTMSFGRTVFKRWPVGFATLTLLGSLVGASPGCVVQDSPYLSLGENLEAGGEAGTGQGSGGTEAQPGAGGTAGRSDGDSGGTAGEAPDPSAGMAGTTPVPLGGNGGEAGTMYLPPAGNGGEAGTMVSPNGGAAGGVPCPTIGCGPEFSLVLPLEDTFGDTIGLYVETCQNDLCLEGELTLTRADIAPGAGIGKTVPEPERADGSPLMTFTVMGTSEGGIELSVSFRLWQQSDAADGDVYRVRVENGDGELIDGREFAVNYERVEIAACTSCLIAHPAPEN